MSEKEFDFNDDLPLFDVEEDEVDDTENEDNQTEEDKIVQKLTQIEQKTNDTVALAKILADPDIRRVLEAKEKGLKFELKELKDEPETPQIDLSGEDDKTKDLMQKVLMLVQSAIKPLEQKLSGIDQYVQTSEGSKIKEEINTVRSKYDDFDSYRETMIELNRRNKDLSVEELYWLAKLRKSGSFGGVNTDTERPRKTTAKPSIAQKTAALPGKKGFDMLLDSALETLDI